MPDMNTAIEGGARSAPGASAAPLVRRLPGLAVLTHPGFVLWAYTATTFLSAPRFPCSRVESSRNGIAVRSWVQR